MLTFKKRPSIRTTIPPARKIDVRKAAEEILGCANPSRALRTVKSSRIFLKAKVDGLPTQEAKKLSGIHPGVTMNEILAEPMAKLVLEEVLKKEPEFDDNGITQRLKEMWTKKRTRSVPVSGGMPGQRKKVVDDDTDLWKYSMDKVLELRGYTKNKDDMNKDAAVTQISFIVQALPTSGNPPIDAQEIKP